MPRLFSGLQLPLEIRQRLASLRAPLPGAKWIEPENMHLTLRFAGDLDNRTATDFADALAAISAEAFQLRLSGLGVFGGKEPRALWADVEPNAKLEALARANETAARTAGLPPEGRNFKAHVTVARLKHCRPDVVARFLQRNGSFRSRPIDVNAFVLFSSRPRSGGGPYVIEEAFALNGGDVNDLRDEYGVW